VTPGKGVSVATSGALGTVAAGADGSTTELANFTAALVTLEGVRDYYMGQSIGTPGGSAFAAHIALKSEPVSGLRSVGVVAFTGTLANAATAAIARNYERIQLVWQANSEHDYAELVGYVLAVRAKRESTDSAFSFDGYRQTDWLVKPTKAVADWPDLTDQNDAINDGITCIASDNAGSYVVMSVNTRSKNSGGTIDDFRATETHRVSVSDELVDELLATYAATYGSTKLRSDELLPNGQPNPNQRLPRGVVTPSTFKPWIRDLIAEYYNGGKLQNLDAMLGSVEVVRSVDNSGRLECGFDINVIDHLHQATFRVAETSAG
jgi:phage tail sheath gpL-like